MGHSPILAVLRGGAWTANTNCKRTALQVAVFSGSSSVALPPVVTLPRCSKPRAKKQAAVNLINQIDKIISHGIKASCATGKLRLLDAELGLYELKGYSGVNREMAYILYQEPLKIVLLFSFKGHQGSGNIHSEIKKARPIARAAKELLVQIMQAESIHDVK